MWLNGINNLFCNDKKIEGFTVFLELELTKRLFGEPIRNLSVYKNTNSDNEQYIKECNDLERTIDSLPSPYTALYIDHSTNGNNMNIENDEEICM